MSDKKVGPSWNGTTIDYYNADVITANDYYTFGMQMPGRSFKAGSGSRYGFNGKEKDNESAGDGNQYDYGFRIYNSRIGKFLSLDPLQTKFPYYSPYHFSGNTPIQSIDLDGKEPIRPKALTNDLGIFTPEIKKWTYMALLPSERASGGLELKVIGSSKGVQWEYEGLFWTGTQTYSHVYDMDWVMYNGVFYNATGVSGNMSLKDLIGKETWEQYWSKQENLQNSSNTISERAGTAVAVGQLASGFKNVYTGLKALAEQRARSVLIKELAKNGVKHNADDIVDIAKSQSGTTVFLETGNSKSGLTHILEKHADDFVKSGIKKEDIAKVVMDAATNGKQVGMQGTRPIYEVIYNGAKKNVAVTVGKNGFVVGANPAKVP